eukprot:7088020-Karenia_brevis.AAC.1
MEKALGMQATYKDMLAPMVVATLDMISMEVRVTITKEGSANTHPDHALIQIHRLLQDNLPSE